MINIKSTQILLMNSLAVPRLGNVQLRFHFLRRGTNKDQYVKVCNNSDAANIISFPTVSAFVSKPKTPDFGKDKPIISQSEQAKEVTLSTQQNQVIVSYQLIDASGKLVRGSESKSETITFSSNGLPTGFYSVILKTEKSVLTSKLVIQ